MKKLDYKWVTAGICFLMIFVGLGFCSSIQGLFVAPLTDALGISRSTLSVRDSCRYVATAVVNIFFGSLVAKFGTKKLIFAGFVCLIISSFIYGLATNIYMFYLGGVFLGIGLSWTTTTMIGCVVGRWFEEKRGTVMGAILAANGLGGAVATQIVTPIIYDKSDKFGYRKAYLLMALILFITAVIVMIFFKQSPKEFSKHTVRDGHKKTKGDAWQGLEFSQATKKAYFYLTVVCVFFTGMILQGITGIAAAHIADVGIDSAFLAIVISTHSIFLSIFKFGSGVLHDKFGLKVSANTSSVAAVLAMILLALVTPSVTGKIFAVLYGILSALALPLETIMLPLYASDLFGEKSFNKIMGIFVSVNTAGYALGAPLMNLCHDIFGDYKISLILSGTMMFIVLIALQIVFRSGEKQREVTINKEKKYEDSKG